MITLRNDFHNTSVNTRLTHGVQVVSDSTVRRWMRALCGVTECRCGGIRGEQRDENGGRVVVVVDADCYGVLTVRVAAA